MRAVFHPDIPPHIAEVIRHLPPDLKRSIKAAIRTLSQVPDSGTPLVRELDGFWKYRVRRFRIVYAVDRRRKRLKIIAVGHRRRIYEEVAAQLGRRS
ncbi:MAG: type II toxin-antitoxin system RelE family toxin [Nitrospiraceae bacterium]